MFKFIDLFAGIGGFHIAMHNLGGDCVFASEWDANCIKTYTQNFKNIAPNLFENGKPNKNLIGDITKYEYLMNETSIIIDKIISYFEK